MCNNDETLTGHWTQTFWSHPWPDWTCGPCRVLCSICQQLWGLWAPCASELPRTSSWSLGLESQPRDGCQSLSPWSLMIKPLNIPSYDPLPHNTCTSSPVPPNRSWGHEVLWASFQLSLQRWTASSSQASAGSQVQRFLACHKGTPLPQAFSCHPSSWRSCRCRSPVWPCTRACAPCLVGMV